MAVGNPGAGKSTLLNYLACEVLFKSGRSIGKGLTYQLDIKKSNRGTFIDTPGLADKWLRKKAGEAISTALKTGGAYKILFFVANDDGRFRDQDLTTMKLVLEAAPEMKNNYGIIVNKVSVEIAEDVQKDASVGADLLTYLFSSIPSDRRCAPSNVTYVLFSNKYRAKNNLLIKRGELKTLNGVTLEKFVFGEVPTVQLTRNKARDVNTNDFEAVTEKIEMMEKKMRDDQNEFKRQQADLRKQLRKAEMEKAEQRRRVDDIMREQREQLKQAYEDRKEERRILEEKFDDMLEIHSKQTAEIIKLQNKPPQVIRVVESDSGCLIM